MTRHRPRRARRGLARVVAVAVALVGVADAAAVAHGSSPEPVRAAQVRQAPARLPAPMPGRAAPHVAMRRPAPPVPPPPATVAVARTAALAVRVAPGGSVLTQLTNPTWKGAPLVLLVLGRRGDWLEVLLPVRPNGTHGWVRADAVRLQRDAWRIQVHQARHEVWLWQDDRLVRRYPVAVGAAATPTPNGLFFVDVKIATGSWSGPYGPDIVGTSGYSEAMTTFDDGDALIGLHGTDAPWLLGQSVSHGCVRMRNKDAAELASLVPLGTPVQIGD